MEAYIDKKRRLAKQRAHTATHLLHAVLQTYFPQTKQEGSFVWEDELRFDFSADRLLSDQELLDIEERMNVYISQWLLLDISEMNYKEAITLGAKAFFADTYGETVRVVSILDDDTIISRELCWWNHVISTDMIGAFCIENHEAVASGIKRITAYTWPKVIEKIHQQSDLLSTIAGIVKVKSAHLISDKLQKMTTTMNTLENSYKLLLSTCMTELLQKIEHSHSDTWHYIVNVNDYRKDSSLWSLITTQDFIQTSKLIWNNDSWIIYDSSVWFIAICDPIHKRAKEYAQTWWVKWWWTDEFVQGKIDTIPTNLF